VNKLAVITGATSGIGAEFARQLAATHKTLWLIGRREQKLNQLAENLRTQHGIEAHVMIMDLSEQSVIDQLASQLQEQNQLSTLVNNAGYAEDGEYHKLDWRLHQDIMNVHVEATLKLSYAALQVMTANKQGSIINVSSVASFLPTSSSPLYGPTKAFIRSFSESLAIKYKDYNHYCPVKEINDYDNSLF
jgi:short-subunit dehydrogenase